MKTALVTGDRGFVGRHLTAALSAARWNVTGVDLADGTDARDYFRTATTRFDVVIHCAAVVGGRALIDGAPLALAPNLELDAGLFGWALRTRPGRVVYLSSSAAYPVRLQKSTVRLPLAEDFLRLDHPGMPDQLYGWAKLTGEILAARARSEGLAVSVCRPFSGYGEDQGTDYPFCAFAARAGRREDPFVVWGSGTQSRDFIHVSDIAAAVLAMIDGGIDGPVNLGTGRPTTMTGLAGMFCAAAGYSPRVTPARTAPAGVAYRVADITRMSAFFTPAVSLEEGVARALACA